MGNIWYNTEIEISDAAIGANITSVTVHTNNKYLHDEIVEAVRKVEEDRNLQERGFNGI